MKRTILVVATILLTSSFVSANIDCFGLSSDYDPYVCGVDWYTFLSTGTCIAEDKCLCEPGWSGSACQNNVGVTCDGIANSDPSACNGNGACVRDEVCDCDPGFGGTYCESFNTQPCFGLSPDDPDVCSGSGTCVNRDECLCDSNLGGDQCQLNEWYCYDSGDHVYYHYTDGGQCNANGLCVDRDTCECYEGYEGSECQFAEGDPDVWCYDLPADYEYVCSGKGSCVGNDECACEYGYGGGQCWGVLTCDGIDAFESDVCGGHGACRDWDDCQCDPGYMTTPEGDNCEFDVWSGYQPPPTCFEFDQDDILVCGGHGACVAQDVCSCDPQWSGDQCQIEEVVQCNGLDAGDAGVCSGQGLCVAEDYCECDDGYIGYNCEQEITCNGVSMNDPGVCSGLGTCEYDGTCMCDPDWAGVNCEDYIGISCSGLGADDPAVCSGNGDCIAPDICVCLNGYSGPECEVDPVTQCFGIGADDPAVCSGNGVCVAEDTCACSVGWMGPECSDSPPNQCFGMDAGDPAVCSGNGDCIAPDICVCLNGYSGPECEVDPVTQCFGMDAGDLAVCSGNGICIAPDICVCDPEWEGANCQDYTGPVSCSSNSDCDAGLYCDKTAGSCEGIGTCAVSPEACPDVWDPVCGCDGNTYGNACDAASAGVSVAHVGECPIVPSPCFSNGDCDVDSYCATPDGACEGGGRCELRPGPEACVPIWDPVCGCDGVTYSNVCVAAQAGVSVAHGGECPIVPGPCMSNSDCDVNSYCAKDDGSCESNGICESRPGICPFLWDPVCGCDGITYDNSCYAAQAGVSVAHVGECPIVPSPCSSNDDCELDSYCVTPAGACEGDGTCAVRPQICIALWDPVCGCDGNTYGNACNAASAGVSVAYGSECLAPPVTQCFGIDAGDPAVCSGNGDCVEEDTCVCQDGYEGDDCSLEPVIFVDVDIKPRSCPNPLRVNFKGNGVLPVAILGSEDFNVLDVDVASITLEGVSPVRSGFDDVSAPLVDGAECECTNEGPDGYLDLVLKFKRKDILAALEDRLGDLGEIGHRTDILLTLTAALMDEETEIEGTDCIRILNRKMNRSRSGSGSGSSNKPVKRR